MTKTQYLRKLEQELAGIPADERQDILLEFASHIDDSLARKPDLPEEDVISLLPEPASVAREFLGAGPAQSHGSGNAMDGATSQGSRENPKRDWFGEMGRIFRYARGEPRSILENIAGVKQLELTVSDAEVRISLAEESRCRIDGYWEEQEPVFTPDQSGLRIAAVHDVDSVWLELSPEVERFVLRSASGSIQGTLPAGCSAEVHIASGDVDLELNQAAARISSASGDIQLRGSIGPVEVKTASGDVSVSGLAGDFACVTASGDVYATFSQELGDCAVTTMSGDIVLSLLSGDHAQLDLSTISGDIAAPACELRRRPGKSQAVREGGPGSVRAKSMSGDISLNETA